MLKKLLIIGLALWGLWPLASMAEIDPELAIDPAPPALLPICVRGTDTMCGLLTRQGKWVVKPTYASIAARGDGWVVEKDRREGYLDAHGKIVLQPEFGSLGTFSSGLVSAEGPDGKNGYLDQQGQWAIAPTYFMAGQFVDGLAVVYIWKGSSNNGHSECWYIKPDGKPAFPHRWNDCDAFDNGLAVVRTDAKPSAAGESGKRHINVINVNGKTLLPALDYQWLKPVSPDRIVAHMSKGGEYRLYDDHGKVLFKVPSTGRLDGAGADRLYYSVDGSGRGLLDATTGKPLVKPNPDWSYGNPFSDGVAWIAIRQGGRRSGYVLIDRFGKVVLKGGDYTTVKPFHAGVAAVRRKDGHWQLIDKQGKAVTPAIYDTLLPAWKRWAQTPRPGDVWVGKRADNDDKVWIDAHGKVLATVRKASCGIEQVIDGDGKPLWPQHPEVQCVLMDEGPFPDWDLPEGTSSDVAARIWNLRVAKARDSVAAANDLMRIARRRGSDKPQLIRQIMNAPWQVGPTTIRLGDAATLKLPAGYRYLPHKYVYIIRKLLPGRLPPEDVAKGDNVGLVADDKLNVLFRVVVKDEGHVDTTPAPMPVDILKQAIEDDIQYRGGGFIGSGSYATDIISWLLRPRWNVKRKHLQWAFRDTVMRTSFSDGKTRSSMTHAILLRSMAFGRTVTIDLQGVYFGIFGYAQAVLNQDAIDKILSQLKFLPGQGYDDAVDSDPRASLDLLGHITNDKGSNERIARELVEQKKRENAPEPTSADEVEEYDPRPLPVMMIAAIGTTVVLLIVMAWLWLRKRRRP